LFGVRILEDDDGVMKNSVDLSMNDIHISECTYVLILTLTACTIKKHDTEFHTTVTETSAL
jgi:hypothetical protein